MSKLRISSGKQYLHKQILSCRLTSSLMFARWHSIHSKVTSIYKTMTWCRYLLISTYIYFYIYLHTFNRAKHKKTYSYIVSMVNVNIFSTVPCSKPDHNSTQLHLLTQNYCTLQLFSSCSYTLQPNTEMKELKFAPWCMTCWIFLTLTCSSHCHTFKAAASYDWSPLPSPGNYKKLRYNQLLNMGHLQLSSYNLSTLSNRNEEKCTKFMQVHTVCLQFKCPLVKPHLD